MYPNINYHFTLVHGTTPGIGRFRLGKNAAWTRPDAPLSRTLERLLPGCIVDRFEWDGKNSVKSRHEAQQRLAAKLRRNIHENQKAKRYIVAHSHGGNIGLYALRNSDVANGIHGLVCLSTPFLNAKPRNLGSDIFYMLFALFFGLFFATTFMVDRILSVKETSTGFFTLQEAR